METTGIIRPALRPALAGLQNGPDQPGYTRVQRQRNGPECSKRQEDPGPESQSTACSKSTYCDAGAKRADWRSGTASTDEVRHADVRDVPSLDVPQSTPPAKVHILEI